MAQYANAVISKARAMYGQMLSPAQYDDLLRKQNVQEISAYLREKTPYRAALEGVQDSTIHRRQLENLLHRDLFYQYVRLAKYVREKDSIYQYIVMDLEIELILSSLRNIISDEQEDFVASLPTFMQPYASFNILGLAGARSLDEVIEAVAGTAYEPVLRRCQKQYPPDGNTLRYTRYELALRTCYFSTLLERAKRETRGRASAELRELITMRAELMNLNTIYRMKTYFQADADRIRVTMLPFYSRLRPRQLEEMVSARDTQAFLKLLSATPTGGGSIRRPASSRGDGRRALPRHPEAAPFFDQPGGGVYGVHAAAHAWRRRTSCDHRGGPLRAAPRRSKAAL
ncbi:MAG: V-type ATPase subunit [Anaerotruncus massiliensis (ex Togo et al. 2019)]